MNESCVGKNKKNMNPISDEGKLESLKKFKIIEPILKKEKKISDVSKEEKIHFRTIQNWIKKYKKYGFVGLNRNKRNDAGIKRVCTEEVQNIIEGIYLRNSHLSKASIFRKLKDFTQKYNFKHPSYKTVCNIISSMPKDLVTLAHEGAQAYRQKYDLLYIHEAHNPNEVWQADHMLLDILVFSDNENKKTNRPWLTIIIDDYSRCISGYELSFMAPSAKKTSLALRQGIWNKKEPNWSICGIPSTLYTDHGSDFTSTHIEQVCADLKINLVFSTVGMPRGRGKIERFFRTLNQLLISDLSGYIGSNNSKPLYSLSQLSSLIHKFILEYNQKENEQINKETPKYRWEKNGFLPRLPESVEQLDSLLFTTTKLRKIGRDGIRFQGLKFLDPILAEYVGENVIIRFDPNDLTSIRVFYKNKFLCQPICMDLDKQSVTLKEIQNARNSKRKSLQKEIKSKLSLIDAILNSKDKKIIQNTSVNVEEKRLKLKLYESE